ncbi:hypothetical protein AB1N83_012990 [Pleurotus pulmonarius]
MISDRVRGGWSIGALRFPPDCEKPEARLCSTANTFFRVAVFVPHWTPLRPPPPQSPQVPQCDTTSISNSPPIRHCHVGISSVDFAVLLLSMETCTRPLWMKVIHVDRALLVLSASRRALVMLVTMPASLLLLSSLSPNQARA